MWCSISVSDLLVKGMGSRLFVCRLELMWVK